MFNIVFLRQAFDLSLMGRPFVKHNPLVGSVLVHNNKIVSEGFHERFGEAHAEVNAILKCPIKPALCDLYVTLEPCCLYGKTPPCTDLILSSGIKNVYVGMLDPNPLVFGKGVEILRSKGVHVTVLSDAKTSEMINNSLAYFSKIVTTNKPYLTLKVGMSLDGKITDNSLNSKWITDSEMRKDANLERSCNDAVVIGYNTALVDNCSLGSELGNDPFRVIISRENNVDFSLNVFRDSNFLLASSYSQSELPKEFATFEKRFSGDKVDECELLDYLYAIGNKRIFVEGGSGIFGSFYDAFLDGKIEIDEILIYMSPILIGGKKSLPWIGGNGLLELNSANHFKIVEHQNVGNGLKIRCLKR